MDTPKQGTDPAFTDHQEIGIGRTREPSHPFHHGGEPSPILMKSMSRRSFLEQSGAALLLMAMMDSPLFAQIWNNQVEEQAVPFVDHPPLPPDEAVAQFGDLNKLKWSELTSWITPTPQFFNVSHYNRPVLDPDIWRLHLGGAVNQPMTFSLSDLKSFPREEVIYARGHH